MSSEKSLTPQIRFKGFTEAWEQRKLSDIGEVITGSTPSTQHSEYYSEDGIPWVTPTDIVDNIIHDTPRKLSPLGEKVGRVVPANTILVTCIASIGKNTMLANTGSFNQQINGLVPDKKKYDSYFLLTESFHWSSKMKREAAAGTMQIVNKNEFSAIDTYVPEWAEQKAIGNYFRNIDNLITLHQRKLDALKKIKSALLEKMFPKNGSDVPEIRFAGFTEAWEQRKLDELADIIGGGTPDTNNPAYWDGDIDWYAPAEIEGQRYAVSSIRKITELGLQKSSAKVLPVGRTVLFTSRAGIGKMAILQRPAATNQGFQSLVLHDGTDPYFIYSMGDKIKEIAEGVASGSTFLEISGKMLGNLEVMVPSLSEQNRISTFFRGLDDLITLHQRKLDALKKIKSALLEKMFV